MFYFSSIIYTNLKKHINISKYEKSKYANRAGETWAGHKQIKKQMHIQQCGKLNKVKYSKKCKGTSQCVIVPGECVVNIVNEHSAKIKVCTRERAAEALLPLPGVYGLNRCTERRIRTHLINHISMS
jgi:hypothetical protein